MVARCYMESRVVLPLSLPRRRYVVPAAGDGGGSKSGPAVEMDLFRRQGLADASEMIKDGFRTHRGIERVEEMPEEFGAAPTSLPTT